MATLLVFTVLEAIIVCGVDNIQIINNHTPVWRLLDEIFGNDFESRMNKTNKEVENNFKSYSNLTQIQGQIQLLPGCKN